jgi:Tol biopolymer transport system component
MKIKRILILSAIMCMLTPSFAQGQKPPILYLGHTAPSTKAEIFSKDFISIEGRYEYGVSFSPEQDEVYFSVEQEGEGASIHFSRFKNGVWSKPQIADFTEGARRAEMEAFVTPDGKRIYFTAFDPMNVKIWYVDRSDDGWGKAQLLALPLENDILFYSNAAANGDLYFTNYSTRKMHCAVNNKGQFDEVQVVDIAYGGHGFIAPDQDFLLIDAFKDNDRKKDRDIHVCFRNDDGTWTEPINPGPGVNSDYGETCPSISPDGKYLFFSRYNEEGGVSNVYWVSMEVIEKVRPKK